MKRWTVIITQTVQDQIGEQVMHIAAHSIDNALAWEDRLAAAIRGLEHVTGYAIDEDATDRLGYEVHKLVFEGTYLIHYNLDKTGAVVRVVNFRHGARLPRRGEP